MDNQQKIENRENPIFGRKVFFVNPPLIIENIIVAELRADEYEVFVIDDYHYAKPVLENNKDALVFIYIDDNLNYDQWFNYIKSFEIDENLQSIFIGVLSSKISYENKQRYMMDLKLPGGFIMLNDHINITQKKIKDILELNGAKGRRQYIRLDSRNLNTINGYFAAKDKLYSFNIENISAVGFACNYPKEIVDIFQKNMVYPSVSITLGRKTTVVSCVIFDTRIANDKGFSVMLFTKDVSSTIRQEVKTFIFDTLDEALHNMIENSMKDLTDYSKKISTSDNSNIPEFSEIADSFIELQDDELPELSDSNL